MGFIQFQDEDAKSSSFGGKAAGLARLAQLGFRVPKGAILSAEPDSKEWLGILNWWKDLGNPPLAVRSSAAAEDGEKTSFAGQNKSFLNVENESSLKSSIHECFASIDREASSAYREFFKADTGARGGMNVVLQEMVRPQFAGVFFTKDPRESSKGWILEVIEGLGEDLVSGKKTPGFVSENGTERNLPNGFSQKFVDEIVSIGLRVSKALQFEVDMEWAVDQDGLVQVLQARPITTIEKSRSDTEVSIIAGELARLEGGRTTSTTWDGQTFAEWSGFPSYFTFSIWKNAFSPHHAFGNALKVLGYQSFVDAPYEPKDSLLERVFGRAYLNVDRLTDLYYGPIPYRVEPKPRPHTRFEWRKISIRTLSHLPRAMVIMLRVSWNLSTKRKFWLSRCSLELNRIKGQMARPLDPEIYQAQSTDKLVSTLSSESRAFSKDYLHWPLVLVVLTESSVQRLQLILSQILGEKEAGLKIREWMGKGLHTVTLEMQHEYEAACRKPELKAYFLAKYGHRGPGELDLINPRWNELKDQAFKPGINSIKTNEKSSEAVLQEIASLKSFKREIVLEEWQLLQQMLELREQWKMEILKPYAQIRVVLEVLKDRLNSGPDIHWLRLSEVESLASNPNEISRLQEKIRDRKMRFSAFKKYSFPDVISLNQIRSLINGESLRDADSFDGEPLSPGVTSGEVRIVEDPNSVDLSQWPEDVILVAETTDPGWTPLFARSKAIVVERGGVLSHCAIVAREMEIPAVSGIHRASKILKNGDRLWVDGNRGRISRE